MDRTRAVVVGGGIGGLTAAVALRRRGWAVTVLERADALTPVGAALSVTPNAQRALDVVGLGDQVRDLSAWQGDGGLRTPGGRWLSRTNSRAATERFGGPVVLLHRATLVDILTSALPPDAVRTGVDGALRDPGGPDRAAVVGTPDGDIEADLVIGADGVRSGVRGVLFPGHPGPRHSGLTTWRVVVPSPDRPFAPHETWGRGALWGSQPLKDGRVYAYAMAPAPEGDRAPDGEKAELLRRFGDWHHPVPGIIAAAYDDGVLRYDVHHMVVPLPAHHAGRVALLGDAAHAMLPTLGQGGNQAVEDAVVLAHHVGHAGDGTDLAAGLAAYTEARLPRTSALVQRSARTGRMTSLRNPVAVAARNTLIAAVSLLGPGVPLRGFADVAEWRPPQRPYAAQKRSGA
ncbi:FAD-dependent monooxygenase [Streptomyces sp. NBC_01508]|uniref:FAD-dependent monooxygenase n=1 Tax=Streptomyces sp. NBC_01508 TaxID=2903888 RepID=UPI003869E3B9